MQRARATIGALLATTVALGACASTTSTTATTKPTATTATTATSASTRPTGPSTSTKPTAPSASTAAAEVNAAGDIPDNQVFVTSAPAGAGYTVNVPEGWARATDGAATTFTDKYNTIRIETVAAASAPTVATVTGVDLAAIAANTKGYAAGKVSTVTRTAGQAVLATYQADAPANAVTTKSVRLDVERYVFWKNGKAAIITVSSASGSDNVDPWRTVTDGFRWV